METANKAHLQPCTVCCRHRRSIGSLGLCLDEPRTSFSPANVLSLKRIQKVCINLSSICLFFPPLDVCSLLLLFSTSFSQRPRGELGQLDIVNRFRLYRGVNGKLSATGEKITLSVAQGTMYLHHHCQKTLPTWIWSCPSWIVRTKGSKSRQALRNEVLGQRQLSATGK
jgi:hypothetical protein